MRHPEMRCILHPVRYLLAQITMTQIWFALMGLNILNQLPLFQHWELGLGIHRPRGPVSSYA